jgi:tRNA A37 threonylcarbamoyladenosine dehydratase
MHKPKRPTVGQSEPTRPSRADITTEEACDIANTLLERLRQRRIGRRGGISRLRSLEGSR